MLQTVDQGTGTPVVLLHAYPCDHTLFDAQAAALVAAGYRVIRPDLPGFGGSALPASGEHRMAAMADAVLADLDQRGIGTFVLGGLSMGGYAAMQILRQQPERVAALALLDTKATPDGPEARAVREETAQRALAAGSLEPLAEGMLQGLLGSTTREQRPDVVARTLGWIRSARAESAAWAMRTMADRPDSLPTLAQYARPALVVAGTEDALSPLSEHELMADALADGRLATIEACGHLSAVERPAEVSEALLAFLGDAGPAIQ
jgi:pimeloyl-ACP methyl ester carboxylesterase